MMILISILVLGVMGLIFAGLLGFAADYFRVEEDPRVGQLVAVLPGGTLHLIAGPNADQYAAEIRGQLAGEPALTRG